MTARDITRRLAQIEVAVETLNPAPTAAPPWRPAALQAATDYARAEIERGEDLDQAIARGRMVYSEASTRWLTGAAEHWRETLGNAADTFDSRSAPASCKLAGNTAIEELSCELASGMWPPHLWQFRCTRDAYERAFGQPWPPPDVAARHGWRAPHTWGGRRAYAPPVIVLSERENHA